MVDSSRPVRRRRRRHGTAARGLAHLAVVALDAHVVEPEAPIREACWDHDRLALACRDPHERPLADEVVTEVRHLSIGEYSAALELGVNLHDAALADYVLVRR